MATILCPICGMPVSDDEKTCKCCGSELKPEEASAPLQETAPAAAVPPEETRQSEDAAIPPEESGREEPKAVSPEGTGGKEAPGLPENVAPFPSASSPSGFPAGGSPVPYQPEFSGSLPEKKRKKKRIVLILCLVMAVLIGLAAALTIIYVNKEKERKAEEEYRAAYNAYIDDMKEVRRIMSYDGIRAEEFSHLLGDVWCNQVFHITSGRTDPYTRPNGIWESDIDGAAENLYAEYESTLVVLIQNQYEIKDLMDSMGEPPEGLEESYQILSDAYYTYKRLTDLIIDPSGKQYTTYIQEKNDAVLKYNEAFNKLSAQKLAYLENK